MNTPTCCRISRVSRLQTVMLKEQFGGTGQQQDVLAVDSYGLSYNPKQMGSNRQYPVTCDTNKQVPWLGYERGHLRSNKERHDEYQDFNNMMCLGNVHEYVQTEQFRYDDYVVQSLEDSRPVRGRV